MINSDIGVPPQRINEIVLGKRRITADTALRLAKYFGMFPKFKLTHSHIQMARELGLNMKSCPSRSMQNKSNSKKPDDENVEHRK